MAAAGALRGSVSPKQVAQAQHKAIFILQRQK
jgi:hypothetical protein